MIWKWNWGWHCIIWESHHTRWSESMCMTSVNIEERWTWVGYFEAWEPHRSHWTWSSSVPEMRHNSLQSNALVFRVSYRFAPPVVVFHPTCRQQVHPGNHFPNEDASIQFFFSPFIDIFKFSKSPINTNILSPWYEQWWRIVTSSRPLPAQPHKILSVLKTKCLIFLDMANKGPPTRTSPKAAAFFTF